MTNEEITNAIAEAASQAFARIHEQVAEFEKSINQKPKTEPPPSKDEVFRQNMDNIITRWIDDKKKGDPLDGKDPSVVSSKKVSGSGPLSGKEV